MAEERVQVRSLMSREIVTVEPDTTVREALAKMEQHGIHELPVMQGSTLRGWVNYDTLIQRAHVPAAAKVTTVMAQGPRLRQDTGLVDAADALIRQNARAAAVVDAHGQVVGVLSRTDLMKAAGEIRDVASLSLERVMTRDLETASENDVIDEAARRLRTLSIRQLLVLDGNGKLVGTVGSEAVMHALTAEDGRGARSHSKAANLGHGGASKERRVTLRGLVEPALSLPPHATLAQAIERMAKGRKSAVVVVDEGFPVGIVSRSNVLERLAARRVQDGPLVQVIGLSGVLEGGGLDHIHALARNTLRKVEREFRLEFLSLHYKVYKAKTDGDSKFSVTAHLSTEKNFIVAKADDWDPIRCTNEVLGELERRAFEAKELRLERRKRPAARKARFYSAA